MNWGRIVVGAMILVPLAAVPVGFLTTTAETPFHWFLVACLAVLLAGIVYACLYVIGRDSQTSVIEEIIESLGKIAAKWRSYFPVRTAPGTSKPAWKSALTVLASLATIGAAGYAFWQGSRGGEPPPPSGPETPPIHGANPPPKPEVEIERHELPQMPPPVITRNEWLGVTGESDAIPSNLNGTVSVNVNNQPFAELNAKNSLIDPEELVWWPCVTRSRVVQLTKQGQAEEYDLHAAFLADFRDLANCQRAKADELSPAQHVPAQGIRLSSEAGQADTYETKPVLGGEEAQDFDLQMGIIIEALGPKATIGVEAYGVGFQWMDDGQGPSITGWKPKPNSKEFEPFRQDLDLRRPWVDEKLILRVRRHGTEVRFYVGTIEVASGRVPPDIFHCDNRSLKFSVRDARIVLQSALVFGIESERLFKPQIEELKTRFKNTVNSPLTPKTLAHAAPG